MELLSVDKLSFTYAGQDRAAIKDLSFTVEEGDFVLLCGPSGGGKSTLLKLLKPSLTPEGTRTGSVRYGGVPLDQLPRRQEAAQIGFVLQDPDSQLCADTVWQELCFQAESLGMPPDRMGVRMAETADFFGLEDKLHRGTADLSGGEKQLLSLAAVMAAGPRVLLLDEPTSQLDPVAAGEFLTALRRLHEELGLTILLSEHRLEEAYGLCDKVLYLKEGRQGLYLPPAQAAAEFLEKEPAFSVCLPAAARLHGALGGTGEIPLSVRQGRAAMRKLWNGPQPPVSHPTPPEPDEEALTCKDVWFRYERQGRDVLRGVSLRLFRGQITALLGGNGAGKSTLGAVLCGVKKPYRGKIRSKGRTVLLPQDPKSLFFKATLWENLLLCGSGEEARQLAQQLALTPLLDRHPYDLSGGQQQKAALAMALLRRPDMLVLDEPTKGLDGMAKQEFAQRLKDLADSGMSILLISHDVEFCAELSCRCLMLFDGKIVFDGPGAALFADNRFYTTAAARMLRGILPGAVTRADVLRAWGARHEE